MTQTIRVSLPGADALTETDLDKYALYADSDNVLIKEHSRGAGTLGWNVSGTITHSLGYVPAYMVYTEVGSNTYRIVNAQNPVGGGWKAYANTTELIIFNGFSATYTGYKYYIFYDDMSAAGTASITESNQAVKVSKQGINVLTSTDPNE